MLNTETKILLLVFTGLILLFLLYNGKTENFVTDATTQNIDNQANDQYNTMDQQHDLNSIEHMSTVSNDSNNSNNSNVIPSEDMIKYFAPNDYSPPEKDWLAGKFNGRNKAKSGEYKNSSYNKGMRGALGPSDWDEYFDQNNNVIGGAQGGSGDNFMPVDESNKGFAVFKSQGKAVCGSNQDCEPEDLFDVDKYLPQEVNDDWYEVLPEPVSVKNRHLINISKPVGVNSIGSSMRNANYDLRASPVNPKQAGLSPWLNSSIDADLSIKPLF